MKTMLPDSSTEAKSNESKLKLASPQKPLRMSLASIGKDGKVTIAESNEKA